MEYLKFFENYIKSSKILEDFNKQKTIPFNGYLYHGTSVGKVKSVLNNGIGLFTHRELRFDSFSTSTNDKMIDIFGRGNGLVFNVDYSNILVLNDFYYKLFGFESGIEGIESEEDILKAEQLGFKDRFGDYVISDPHSFIDTYYTKNPKFKDSEGIALDDISQSFGNEESEIIITENNHKLLESNLELVVIDGEYYDIKRDKNKIDELLSSVEEEDWDDDSDYHNI